MGSLQGRYNQLESKISCCNTRANMIIQVHRLPHMRSRKLKPGQIPVHTEATAKDRSMLNIFNEKPHGFAAKFAVNFIAGFNAGGLLGKPGSLLLQNHLPSPCPDDSSRNWGDAGSTCRLQLLCHFAAHLQFSSRVQSDG